MLVVSILFGISILVIVCMAVKIYETSFDLKSDIMNERESVARASRLLIQSATQYHPLFALLHVHEARYILLDVARKYNGILHAERVLSLKKGSLKELYKRVERQAHQMNSCIMNEILPSYPQLDTSVNDLARLT